MKFTIDLNYTPRCPQPGLPFTEANFTRQNKPFTFDVSEVGVALVDVWNFGWEDGPVGETLGPELSLERGISHAQRKRQIIENVISPTVSELRKRGAQIFHCTHSNFLERYPQWLDSTTEAERESLKPREKTSQQSESGEADKRETWPPEVWVKAWREEHREALWRMKDWGDRQGKEVYPKIDLPAPVKPLSGDLLVFSREQFHRLLTERKIRVLFYMGFETTECLQFSGCGIANMQPYGYLCVVLRDGTTTYEMAETLDGLWRTRIAILDIEARWGYSVISKALLDAVQASHHTKYGT